MWSPAVIGPNASIRRYIGRQKPQKRRFHRLRQLTGTDAVDLRFHEDHAAL